MVFDTGLFLYLRVRLKSIPIFWKLTEDSSTLIKETIETKLDGNGICIRIGCLGRAMEGK